MPIIACNIHPFSQYINVRDQFCSFIFNWIALFIKFIYFFLFPSGIAFAIDAFFYYALISFSLKQRMKSVASVTERVTNFDIDETIK